MLTRRPRLLTQVNPMVLIAIGAGALVGSFFVRTVPAGLVGLTAELAAAVAFIPGLRHRAWRVLPAAAAGLSVAWSTWLVAGHHLDLASSAGLRILVLALPGVLLAPLVDAQALGDHLAQTMHLPARPVVAATTALQRVETLSDAWSASKAARRIRGLGPGRSPLARLEEAAVLTFGLLVEALRGAERSALALDARGFATAQHRTWAEPARWTHRDVVVVVVGVLWVLMPAWYVLST